MKTLLKMKSLWGRALKTKASLEMVLKVSLIIYGMLVSSITNTHAAVKEVFPDGTPISNWFKEATHRSLKSLGKQYNITDYGVLQDSTMVQTKAIQAVIDRAASQGGGVIVIPKGTFLSGSLFFKPKTHLYIKKGGTLKGSDDISDFRLMDTRIEGQNLKYFAALINAIHSDGFTLTGEGMVNGNGLRYWRSFWLRRKYNPQCTNLEEMRPRLVFISHSNDVELSGVCLHNSPFWTTHIYKSNRVKLLGLHLFAPKAPVKAPSSDAIDIDVCQDVLVKNCYLSVNDDAVALKGGKGPWADRDTVNNGSNERVIIEDCIYGFCHSALTCGSESVHNRNIILRRTQVNEAQRLLWLKMRPDTPQNYEYITVENITGSVSNVLYVKPWTQFFDLKDCKETPKSYSSHITLRRIQMDCSTVFAVIADTTQYELRDFVFEDLKLKVHKNGKINTAAIRNLKQINVEIE